MRPDISGPPPLERERRPGQEAAHLKNSNNGRQNNSDTDLSQEAEIATALHLCRKHLIRLPFARVLAGEMLAATGASR
jgi:hypothetical protein